VLNEVGEGRTVEPLVAFYVGFEEGADFDADARSAVEVNTKFD